MWSPFGFHDRNEDNVNALARNNWRASLVPAAAVIPAPRVYIKVVAVKKLVVGPWRGTRVGPPFFPRERFGDRGRPFLRSSSPFRGGGERGFSKRAASALRGRRRFRRRFTLNKLGCSKRAFTLRIHQHGIMKEDLRPYFRVGFWDGGND